MRKMKDSGIEWIGEIPNDWRVYKVKNICRIRGEKNRPQAQVLSVYRELGVVVKAERNDNHNVTSEDTSSYKYVLPNDLVVNKMKAWQGSMGISRFEGIVSPAYYVFKIISDEIYPMYIHYLLRNVAYLPEYRRLSGGIRPGQWDLSIENLQNIPILIPPYDNQCRIVSYLERKCSQIDDIIARQQEVIEKLKAYKLSVITEAVTKGLNPDARMKDSGVEWIGEIPNSWVKVKLKNICQFINGDRSSNYPSPNEYVDDGIPFLGADSLCGRYVDITQSKKITKEKYNSMGGAKIHEGDILYTLRGSTIGKNAMATFNDGTVASSLMVIRPISIVPEYLLYWLNSEEEFQQRQSYINGSTAPNLSAENVGSFVMFLPSVAEQREIADYLDKKCTEIELTMLKKQMMADQLSNYKKSLIYEVVTGKKEV